MLLIAIFAAVHLLPPQQPPVKDIAAVYAEGKSSGTRYTNGYFGLTLDIAPGEFTQGGFLSEEGKRARLIDAQYKAANPEDRFEIAILADLRSANPKVLSAEHYARIARHQFEKQGMTDVKTEAAVQVSGVQFTEAILKEGDGASAHCRGIYSTILNGYILSIDVSAPTPERIEELVGRAVKFELAAN
jgi:hypothetical protein